ncbi:MAG: VCBS repeat-containing protein [Verrucomicrobiales bacterium]
MDEERVDSAIADFNGDGNIDYATIVGGSDEVAILLGQGSAALRFATGPEPVAIAIGYFNEDDILDLVTANEGAASTGEISLLFGNGDGTFQNPISIAIGGRPEDIATGDFDGDSSTDLVVAKLNEPAGLLMGNGDGTFEAIQSLDTMPATSVKVANLNPAVDGSDDIITDGTILFGNGDGTFAEAVDFWTEVSDQVWLEDLDGNGHPDIILTSKALLLASVFRLHLDGTVDPPTHYVTDNFPEEPPSRRISTRMERPTC